MRLEQALVGYGLLANIPLRAQWGLYIDSGQDHVTWAQEIWPRSTQFDELFSLLEQIGDVERQFTRSALHYLYHGQVQIGDLVINVDRPQPRYCIGLPDNASGRPLLYHQGASSRLVARLCINDDRSIDTLERAVREVLLMAAASA